MRLWWVVLVAGCGFQVTITGDAATSDDAPPDDASELDIDASPIDAPACPANYFALGNEASRYFLRNEARELEEHHELCTADGTHLVVIDTAAEAALLRELVDTTQGLPTTQFGPLVYIGAAQRPNQSSPGAGWISATGTFNPAFWAFGEPNDGAGIENGDEHLAAIWRGHDLIADVRDDHEVAAICECDGKAVTPAFDEALLENLDE